MDDGYLFHAHAANGHCGGYGQANQYWADHAGGERLRDGDVLMVCEQAIKKLRLNRDTTRVVVQGFGNVGSNAARLMAEAGYKVIGIVEVGGGLYNKNGIDAEAVWEFRQRNGSIHGFAGAEAYDPAELMLVDCDILIPAATENQITCQMWTG